MKKKPEDCAHSSFFSVYQQSTGVSKMSKKILSVTLFPVQKKGAFTGDKAECTVDAARKGDILSNVSEALKNPQTLLQTEVALSTGASAVQNRRRQIPNLETKVEITLPAAQPPLEQWGLGQQNKLCYLLQEWTCSCAI